VSFSLARIIARRSKYIAFVHLRWRIAELRRATDIGLLMLWPGLTRARVEEFA
jgi:hypothetical protein